MEPICGFTSASSVWFVRCMAYGGVNEDILGGLVWPMTAEMAARSQLEPLEAGLSIYRLLLLMPDRLWWGYYLALRRLDASIVERDRLIWLEQKRAERPTAGGTSARGTRSTQKKRKAKAGRR